MVTAMDYRWNPDMLGEAMAVPAAVVDEHIKMAGEVPLKVLLWLLRNGSGAFDAKTCGRAIGKPAADCADAVDFWMERGLLLPAAAPAGTAGVPDEPAAMTASIPAASERTPTPDRTRSDDAGAVRLDRRSGQEPEHRPRESAPAKTALVIPFTPSAPASEAASVSPLKAAPRPQPVKPLQKEVIARQKASGEFNALVTNVSASLGKALSPGDTSTLLYLYDTAGLPPEVIMMVVGFAVKKEKRSLRYIEKTALDWADRGLDTIPAAEEYLCALERREDAWRHVGALLGVDRAPASNESAAAARWRFEWSMNDAVIRLAHDICMEKTGKFSAAYMDKILNRWFVEGVDTVEKAAASSGTAKKAAPKAARKAPSYDLDAYAEMVRDYVPVYKSGK